MDNVAPAIQNVISRNFPTQANVERKIAEKTEMEKRGETMGVYKSSYEKSAYDKNVHQRKRKRNSFDNSKNEPKLKKNTVSKFLSTASLPDDLEDTSVNEENQSLNISDEEWGVTDTEKKVNNTTTTPVSNILLNISNTYASDEEDKEDYIKKNIQIENIENDSESDLPEEVQNCKPVEEVCINEKEIQDTESKKKVKKLVGSRDINNKYEIQKWMPCSKKRPLTMLEKLLSQEIKQERNQILQCIRYITSQNFFNN